MTNLTRSKIFASPSSVKRIDGWTDRWKKRCFEYKIRMNLMLIIHRYLYFPFSLTNHDTKLKPSMRSVESKSRKVDKYFKDSVISVDTAFKVTIEFNAQGIWEVFFASSQALMNSIDTKIKPNHFQSLSYYLHSGVRTVI